MPVKTLEQGLVGNNADSSNNAGGLARAIALDLCNSVIWVPIHSVLLIVAAFTAVPSFGGTCLAYLIFLHEVDEYLEKEFVSNIIATLICLPLGLMLSVCMGMYLCFVSPKPVESCDPPQGGTFTQDLFYGLLFGFGGSIRKNKTRVASITLKDGKQISEIISTFIGLTDFRLREKERGDMRKVRGDTPIHSLDSIDSEEQMKTDIIGPIWDRFQKSSPLYGFLEDRLKVTSGQGKEQGQEQTSGQ